MTEGPSHVECESCDNVFPWDVAVYFDTDHGKDWPYCPLCFEAERERREQAQWEAHCSDHYGGG